MERPDDDVSWPIPPEVPVQAGLQEWNLCVDGIWWNWHGLFGFSWFIQQLEQNGCVSFFRPPQRMAA